MKLTLAPSELASYLCRQLDALFPCYPVSARALRDEVDEALQRIERCFAKLSIKYFQVNGEPRFDPLHTDQYAMFLYILGNTIWRRGGDERLAGRLYALNKALHCVDIFYEITLPEVWCLQHAVGTVLGRATYGDFFCAYQGCLVGVGLDGRAPLLGRGVVLFGGASVVGACTIGENVWISTGAAVFDEDVPGNNLVIGRSPDLVVRPTRKNVERDFFTLPPPQR